MTAATIPKIKAADEPVLRGASLLGAEVPDAAESVAVRDAELRVLVMSPNVASPLEELKVAVLKVEFLAMAVPVPDALAMLVMLMVLLPVAKLLAVLVAVALEAEAEEEEEDDDSPPSTVKRPE